MLFDLELVSPCNATCSFCPQSFRGVKRKQALMDEDVLDKITQEIGALAQAAPEERFQVSFCGMGETLLKKPLLLRALDNLDSFSGGSIETLLVTNGSHLTLDLLEHASFRKLSGIQVSFTGFGKDAYEEIFGLEYEKVVRQVTEMAADFPGAMYIRTVDLAREKTSRDEFEKFWNDRGLSVSFSDLHSRGGHLPDPEAYQGKFRPFTGCEIFNLVNFISSDGELLSCCHDITSATTIGDCRTSSLQELIAEKRTLQQSDFQGYDICSKCTDFTLASQGPSFVDLLEDLLDE
jgi:sulfatase maturation enzyme AslB (radical SAM superfamily)